jgi:hypothetical protein
VRAGQRQIALDSAISAKSGKIRRNDLYLERLAFNDRKPCHIYELGNRDLTNLPKFASKFKPNVLSRNSGDDLKVVGPRHVLH